MRHVDSRHSLRRLLILGSLLVCASLSVVQTYAQIEKGITILDLNASWILDDYASVDVSLMTAIDHKWMVGGRISTFGTTVFQISPGARYYLSNSEWAPFASISNDILILDQGFSTSRAVHSDLRIGMGLTRFIGPGVALEGEVTASTIRFGDDPPYSDRTLNLDLGVRLFLGESFRSSVDSLPNHIYRKGVFTTSSFLNYNRSFDERSVRSLSIAPDVEYFVADRLSVSAGFGFSHLKASEFTAQTYGFAAGVTRYFLVSDRFFFNLGLSGRYTKGDDFFQAGRIGQVSASVDVQFSYFAGAKRLFWGYRASYLDFVGQGVSSAARENQVIYAGLDYYLTKNLFLKGLFDVNLTKNNERFIGRGSTGVLSAGIGFNLFR